MKKTVLISGGAKGIGAGICQEFAAEDWTVFLCYRQSESQAAALKEELTEAGREIYTIKADITKEEEVVSMVEEVMGKCGRIDALVNNAGVAQQKLFTDITTADWEYIFDTNVKGMFLLTKEVLRHMLWAKKGRIINMSSIWGICGASCEVHYSASKAAVIGFTKALAKEVGPSGIAVNCIAPGVIDTQMNSGLSEADLKALREETPLGIIGTVQDVANAAVFLASDKAGFITGQVLSPNGGFVI